MTVQAAPVARQRLRLTPTTAMLVSLAALAWAVVVARAVNMGNGIGTMGMSLPGFAMMWALMMTAMMLPAVAPVASLYSRTIRSRRRVRLTLFVGGYLTTPGMPAEEAWKMIEDLGFEVDTVGAPVAS